MKTIIKLLLSILFILAIDIAKAQTLPANAEANATARLATELSIRNEQAAKLHRVLKSGISEQIKAIDANQNLSVAQKRSAVLNLMLARDRRVDSLIGPAKRQL